MEVAVMLPEKPNPILLDLPESFESPRLIIRAPREGDGKALNEAVLESRNELLPWMPWVAQIPTVNDSESNIRRARAEFLMKSDLRLLLFRKDNGELAGSSGLHRIDWEARKFEIGYWLRTSCCGKGYMAEAVEAIAGYAISVLQANRIEIRCDSSNIRSSNVAQRAGFTLEGILRKEKTTADGSLRDTMVYAKVRGIEF
jgi:RimJ/RimL family protein N-acetyltransferase